MSEMWVKSAQCGGFHLYAKLIYVYNEGKKKETNLLAVVCFYLLKYFEAAKEECFSLLFYSYSNSYEFIKKSQ